MTNYLPSFGISAMCAGLVIFMFSACVAERACRRPRLPPYSRTTMTKQPIQGRYPENTIWLLRCKSGYQKSTTRIRECKNGKWTGTPYRCQRKNKNKDNDPFEVSCPLVETPPGGKKKQSRGCCKPGHRIFFKCKTGLLQIGRQRIECLDDGTWSGEPLVCKRKELCVDPPGIENGSVKFKKSYPRLPGSGPEDYAIYTCNYGYHFQKHTFEHYVRCLKSGSWSEQPDICIKLHCLLPKAPNNGYIYNSRNRTKFSVGEKIHYGCKQNFELLDVSERTCDDTAKGWDMWDPVCRKIRCAVPPHPENGRRVGNKYFIGETVRFVCSSGYTLKGSKSRTCMITRRWNGTLTTCQNYKSYCQDPGIPIGGMKHGNRYNHRDIVRFDCKAGFSLTGSRKRECLINHAWSGKPTHCEFARGHDDPEEAARKLKIEIDSLMTSVDEHDDHNSTDTNSTGIPFLGRTLNIGHKAGLDLYFVFDVSGSINQSHLQLAIDFAGVLVQKIGMSQRQGGTRYGIVSFESNVTVHLRPYDREVKTTTDVLVKLHGIKSTSGSTATAVALKETKYIISTALRLSKPSQPTQALILITDGQSNMHGNPAVVAESMRDEFNVDIYCVGLGNALEKKELNSIANDGQVITLEKPENLHKVTDWFLKGEIDYSDCGVRWDGGLPGSDKIQDGWFANDIREWPWMASLYYDHARSKTVENQQFYFFCGASLIDQQWILTAAHCFADPKADRSDKRYIQVRLGQHNRSREAVTRGVDEMYIHEFYDSKKGYEYDVALLHLANEVTLSPKIRTICLPKNIPEDMIKSWYTAKPGRNWEHPYFVLGWGSNETVPPDERVYPAIDVLKTIAVPLANNETCIKSIRSRAKSHLKYFTDGMFCAGDGKGRDACDYDSGGPLLVDVTQDDTGESKAYQLGIVSWSSPGCRQKNQYGVYTKVSDYVPWIYCIIDGSTCNNGTNIII